MTLQDTQQFEQEQTGQARSYERLSQLAMAHRLAKQRRVQTARRLAAGLAICMVVFIEGCGSVW